MDPRLLEALEIIAKIESEDASPIARGHRAHARVLTMIELTKQVGGLREQALIANLLTVADKGLPQSEFALKRALDLLGKSLEGREQRQLREGA